ncbi:hypothetical protein P3W85_09965 [Cupriavidus basilensis]|uniref:Uncharacterized protein n=1 Tax=Cupriavidus basilensis TaxID=68895 RepID=A0ABT6AKY7_9BURK|nr:hypothetical protein [Cupriavidus basilensis]MDF3833269.1 hypothetical protein [Cupriavidus basilensis]
MRRVLAICALAAGAAVTPGIVEARVDVGIGIGIPGPVFVAPPPPVYYEPPPVYYEPVPVYVEPQPVIVAPGYYGDWRARAWQERQWRERRWHEREWRIHHRGWRRGHDDEDD